ncbi:MAG: hypothetical protein LBU89_05320 [Fibromonadaceae bacterium]|jgi:hypothetical protein|nr:hypothetical protein [Fibromonadaceae bacterium]
MNRSNFTFFAVLLALLASAAWGQQLSGAGTPGDPFRIESDADMSTFRDWINEGRNVSSHYRVTRDITWWTNVGRIGHPDRPFRGTFDGGGYTINFAGGINMGGIDYVGFFGCVNGATIRNLTIEGNHIDGQGYVGGLIGYATGSINLHNVHVRLTGTSDTYWSYWGGLIGNVGDVSTINITSSSAIVAGVRFRNSGNTIWGGGLIGRIGASGTANITDCMASIIIRDQNNNHQYIGGLIGSISGGVSKITRSVAISNISNSPNVSTSRGPFIGYSGGNLTLNACYHNLPTHEFIGHNSNIASTIINNSDGNITSWTGNDRVYSALERRDDSGATIRSENRGNESWGFDHPVNNRPKLSKTGYAVLVTAGGNIGKITDHRFASSTSYYVNADQTLTIESNLQPNSRQLVEYTFTPAYTPSSGATTHTLTRTGNIGNLTARVNGTVSAKIINIPTPSSLSATFDQFARNGGQVTLNWSFSNPSSLSGSFWVYRREGTLDNWTRRNATGIALSNNSSYTDDTEFNKTYRYAVVYQEFDMPATSLASFPSTNSPAVQYQTLPNVNTTPVFFPLTAQPGALNGEINISFLPHINFNTGNFDIEFRTKAMGTTGWGIWSALSGGTGSLDGRNEPYSRTHGNLSHCNDYEYRVSFPLYDVRYTVQSATAKPRSNVAFIDNKPLKVSKGEYANQVRLEWTIRNSTTQETYRMSRRTAATNSIPAGPWVNLEIVTSNTATTYWNDNNALTGVFYDYMVELIRDCTADSITTVTTVSTAKDIGFTQAFGTVSGRITFGAGNASPNVNVLVQRNELSEGENQYRSLRSTGGGQKFEWLANPVSNFNDIWTSGRWTLQFWVNPDANNTGTRVIGNIGGQDISMIAVTGGYQIFTAMQTATTARSAIIPSNHFSHITITRDGSNVNIYTVVDKDSSNISIANTSFTTNVSMTAPAAANSKISLGHSLWGNIDDVRFWNRALDSAEIRRNYSRLLVGNENGLRGYWTFDDGLPGYAFDMSRVGTVYNGNHATTNTLAFNTNVPNETYQLALKGITDANGNYQIGGIPYQGEGTSYSIIPMLGVHQFNPTQQLRYISPTSMVHNGTDFTNISSFEVSGTVVYEGGTYPVEGCTFEIDGIQVTLDGKPVTSSSDGRFEISVPIGTHKVQVKKPGHTFVNDGYLTDGNGKDLNYNAPLSEVKFYNTTRVKLIGHIVGGKLEHEKTSGFGLRTNNIGSNAITLTAAKNYSLATEQKNTVFQHNTGDKWANWTYPNNIRRDSTFMKIEENTITITVSSATGEYVAWVYPELYNIQNISAGNYGAIYDRNESFDLRDAPIMDDRMLQSSVYSWPDSVFVPQQGNRAAYWEHITREDTVRYHREWSFYHQEQPSFTIQQLVNEQVVNYFGDKEFELDNATIDLVTLAEGKPPFYHFDKPIFRQGEQYSFALSAFEEYYNPKTDVANVVPVAGGTVSFIGEMLMETNPAPIELDSLGQGVFSFLGGMADLTTGIRNLSARIRIDNLSYDSETFGTTGLSAYVLGGRSTGTDFVTAASDKIDFILHDPPGSNSYAYIEKGTVFSTTYEKNYTDKFRLQTELAGILGVKTITLAGMGVMIGGELETTNKIGAGIEVETRNIHNSKKVETFTFTDRVETSSEPEFVGHHADVYVGRGTNTLYGLTNNITIGKTNDFGDPSDVLLTIGDYTIGKQTALAMGMDFGTVFYYTGYEIENIMIPKWKDVLKNLFVFSEENINTATIKNPVYVSKLPANDPNFGTRNDDVEVWGTEATNDLENGPSYKMILPDALKEKMRAGLDIAGGAKETIEVTDSIAHLNLIIKQWEKYLADNEKRKIDAINNNQYKSGDNISFGSGVTIEKSHDYTKETGKTVGSEFEGNALVFTELGFKALGVGWELKGEASTGVSTGSSTTNDTLKSNTVGFVLSTGGTEDQITVDYTLDHKSIPATFMFRTRGGRTSCPYESEIRTKYFEPGNHIINEGTMQIEVPKIAVSGGANRLQVPATRAASFALDITNESETNGTGWFKLTVDESTNPHGAVLKIDGMPIANGRYFSVPSGQVLKKTLTVEKGPNEDVYENIHLILASDCDPDLSDEIIITVEFLPSCSEVAIKSPYDNWLINTATGDSIMVELENYDVNFTNFSYVELLYRLKSAPQWSSAMKFYSDQTRYDQAQGPKTLLGTESSIKYWWYKDQKIDGEYEFSARTICETIGDQFVADYATPAISGVMDMNPPRSLGFASPASGILGIGDELSITFNKDIQTGMLTQNNFSITGVLNAQEIAEPSAGINFTGGTQQAKTELPIYTGGSFSIETWFKHDVGKGGTLFAFGNSNNNSISLGFNDAGRAVLKVGEETYTSINYIAGDQTWKFIAMAYDHTNNSVSVYEYEGATNNVLFANRTLTAIPPTQGQLIVGNNVAGNSGFTGAVSQLHFYGAKRTEADIAASKSLSKSGREHGLIGYWAMDEIEGTVAVDKARARNLMLSAADWYVYPSGYAMQTGNGNHFFIPTATYPLNEFSDFTLEFWFRNASGSQTNNVIFSADNGYIAVNASGGLTLYKKDGTENRVLTTSNLMDTKWHHVAMSVRRSGNVNVYINGQNTATFSETLLESFASGFYYFGAKRTPTNTFENYFAGYFDEIRIWNSALTRDGIVLNKNSKLRGNEAGLLAYYPFETYTKQQNNLISVTPTDNNMVDASMAASGATTSTISVPVKDARPVESVPFSYVASNNKIVFTIDPAYFARVEGSTLTLAVKDVRDMRDNKSNTEQWTAFVRRNALQWDREPVYMSMEEGESRSFTAKITNTGGTTVSYSVENLPSWLSIVNSVGNLAPMASRDLTFVVVPGVNIGNYEATIGLTSGNGITEALSVQLKVSGKRPNWIVNPNDFEGSMSITGRIEINGVLSENTENVLAAFIGDQCVGTASLTYISPSNAYFVFSNVYGNAAHNNQPVTFKLWDASTGRIYPKVETSVSNIRFTPTSVLGSPLNPVIFNALDAYEQIITLRKGWNWVSSNVLSDNPSILDQTKSSLGNAGVMVKGQNSYIQQQSSWIGTLGSISEKSMYLINVNRDISLSLQGNHANPATSIGIHKGWNWIGYIPQHSLSVQSALAGINAQTGDIIKSQNSYAVYLGNGIWAGTLTFMQAGNGYMYHSNNAATQSLVYPSQASQQTQSAPMMAMAAPPTEPYWQVDPSDFSNSMTVTSIVMQGSKELRSAEIEIGAFSGEECRGSALLQYVPSEDKYVGFLVVHGEGSEEIKLKVYDHAEGKEHKANNAAINFLANTIYGTPDFYVVNIEENATQLEEVCITSGKVWQNNVCRDRIAADCATTEIFESETKTCRAIIAGDCSATQVFEGGVCRAIIAGDCSATQVFEGGVCRAITADDCSATQVFEGGVCRAIIADNCSEAQVFEGNICRDKTEAELCTANGKIWQNNTCRNKTQQEICIENDKIWQNNTCRSKTQQEACIGAGYNWVGGQCETSIIANQENPLIKGIMVQTKSNAIILTNLPHNAKVEVYNLKGEQMYSATPYSLPPTSLKIEVQIKGIYIVKISFGNEKQILRVPVR